MESCGKAGFSAAFTQSCILFSQGISGHTDYPSTCKTSEFMCNNGQCIPGHWECDDFMDCTDESDEHHDCHATTDWPTTPPIMDYPSTCDSTEFHCESGSDYGNCIPSVWKCDQFDDCYEGTDELDCSPSSTTSWIRTTTATTNFGIQHKKCMYIIYVPLAVKLIFSSTVLVFDINQLSFWPSNCNSWGSKF